MEIFVTHFLDHVSLVAIRYFQTTQSHSIEKCISCVSSTSNDYSCDICTLSEVVSICSDVGSSSIIDNKIHSQCFVNTSDQMRNQFSERTFLFQFPIPRKLRFNSSSANKIRANNMMHSRINSARSKRRDSMEREKKILRLIVRDFFSLDHFLNKLFFSSENLIRLLVCSLLFSSKAYKKLK